MGGRTGYPDYDNSDGFGGPEYFTEIEQHFDALIDPSVATASALPSGGNWPGRTVFVEDTKRTYQWNTTDGWVMLFQVPAAWTNMTLVSGWAATGGVWPSPQYRVNALGSVEIRGQMLPKSGYAAGDTFTTLPLGLRPSAQIAFPVVNNATSSPGMGEVVITTAGAMQLYPAGIGNVNFGFITFATA